MPTLIVEQDDRRKGTVLNGRLVIGRRANNHIAIRDRSVSRIHAWIGTEFERYFISDSVSRTGTLLNGEKLKGRQSLRDGDVIQIANVKMTYHSTDVLPPEVEVLDFDNHKLQGDDGIFFDCACGAPIWVPWNCAGKRGRCRDCGRLLQLPDPPDADQHADSNEDTHVEGLSVAAAQRTAGSVRMAPKLMKKPLSDEDLLTVDDVPFGRDKQKPIPQKAEPPCGACQSSISFLEEKHKCPECGVVFHADCWKENGGCSSYGCSQVGILDRDPDSPAGRTELESADELETYPEPPRPSNGTPKNGAGRASTGAAVQTQQRPAREAVGASVQRAPAPGSAPDSDDIVRAPRVRPKSPPAEATPDLPTTPPKQTTWPKVPARAAAAVASQPTTALPEASASRVQWNYLLLPLALLLAAGGLFAFGIPSLLLTAGIVISGFRKPGRNRSRLSDAVLVLSAIAAAAGAAFSTYWWLATSSAGAFGI